MGNPVPLDTFLEKVRVIYNLHPTYRQPGDGSDGTCDCIGLIIGAIRRAGGSWSGIHGSNYAARYEISDLHDIKGTCDLFIGMAVFKYNDSTAGLPDKYKPGGSKYNGDLKDYYHVGVVTSLDPLKIVHMTSPSVKVDNRLGQWKRGGHLIKVSYGGGPSPMVEKYKMKVSTTGGTLNMRASTKTDSAVIAQIPNGTILPIYDDSASTGMYQTQYKNRVGYVSNKFLKPVEDPGTDTGIFIPLPADSIDTVLNALKNAQSQ